MAITTLTSLGSIEDLSTITDGYYFYKVGYGSTHNKATTDKVMTAEVFGSAYVSSVTADLAGSFDSQRKITGIGDYLLSTDLDESTSISGLCRVTTVADENGKTNQYIELENKEKILLNRFVEENQLFFIISADEEVPEEFAK